MKNKGITLIALIITIIVLLILAGVSVSLLTGENGILNKSQSAKNESQKSLAKEEVQLQIMNLQTKLLSENSKKSTLQDVLSDFSTNSLIQIIDDQTVLNTEINQNSYLIVKYNNYEFKIEYNLKVENYDDELEAKMKDCLTHQYNTKYTNVSELTDLSGNSNNATINGNFLVPNGTVNGTVTLKDDNGTYYTNYSGSGYISSESNIADKYLGNNAKTISCWIRTTNTSSSLSGFLGIGQDGTKTGMLCGIKNGYLYFDTGMYNLYYSNTTYLSDGNWHFICVTFDSTTLKIYVDNNNVFTQSRNNKYSGSDYLLLEDLLVIILQEILLKSEYIH